MASNNFLNSSWVSMQILRLLLNKLTACEYFNRGWEGDFKKEFPVGSSIQVKFPQRFLVSDGMGYQPQGINRISTTIALDQWIQIGFNWDDYENAVKIERTQSELQSNYYEPAAAAMAQEYDNRCAQWAYQHASSFVGQLGTDPNSVTTYYQARQKLMEKACPPGPRCMLISSSMMTALGSTITNVFNPVDQITRQWKQGAIGILAGFDFYESNSLYQHTAGTWAAAVTVNGANQSGTALTITASAGDTFNVGDKFSINNVNTVNPMTRRIPGKSSPQTFTVLTALTAVGGGADVLNILPAIYGPGSQYQNVDALPASGAALTLWPGTTSPNGKVGTVGLGLSKYAFALVGAALFLPTAVEKSGQATDPDSGISVRKVKAWDPYRSMQVQRMDSLFGRGDLYQDNAAVAVLGG
jgi:coat protein Gp5